MFGIRMIFFGRGRFVPARYCGCMVVWLENQKLNEMFALTARRSAAICSGVRCTFVIGDRARDCK